MPRENAREKEQLAILVAEIVSKEKWAECILGRQKGVTEAKKGLKTDMKRNLHRHRKGREGQRSLSFSSAETSYNLFLFCII